MHEDEGSHSSHSEEDHDTGDAGVAVEEGRPRLQEPPQFAVVLHNDDYTTMDFVVDVLQRYFKKTHDEAIEVTMKVHHEGRGVAGIYSHQIAETKVVQVSEYARTHHFPLKCTAEPAG